MSHQNDGVSQTAVFIHSRMGSTKMVVWKSIFWFDSSFPLTKLSERNGPFYSKIVFQAWTINQIGEKTPCVLTLNLKSRTSYSSIIISKKSWITFVSRAFTNWSWCEPYHPKACQIWYYPIRLNKPGRKTEHQQFVCNHCIRADLFPAATKQQQPLFDRQIDRQNFVNS